jgi:hypothetical protein
MKSALRVLSLVGVAAICDSSAVAVFDRRCAIAVGKSDYRNACACVYAVAGAPRALRFARLKLHVPSTEHRRLHVIVSNAAAGRRNRNTRFRRCSSAAGRRQNTP